MEVWRYGGSESRCRCSDVRRYGNPEVWRLGVALQVQQRGSMELWSFRVVLQVQRRVEVWKSGGLEDRSCAEGAVTWKYGSLEVQSHVCRCSDVEVCRSGDLEVWRRVAGTVTWRYGA